MNKLTVTGSVTIGTLLGRYAQTDPRFIFEDGATSLTTRLDQIHRELRLGAALEPLQRIAIAIYDPGTNLVKGFVESSIGLGPVGHFEMSLAQLGSLRHLAETRATRIVDEIQPEAAGRLGDLYRAGLRSSMTIPIYSHGLLFGFVFFGASRVGFFDGPAQERLLPYARVVALLLIHEIMTLRLVRAVTKTAQAVTRLRDDETATHLERMSNYARLIAAEGADRWGLSDEFVEHLFWFAPLHDIGKVAVPDSILLKPGRLTDAEMAEMRLHVTKGVEIIDAITGEFGLGEIPHIGMARNIIAFHHENFDGSGYPAGAAGHDIPIESRIVAVADVFDALTSVRPYKPQWSNGDALDFVRDQVGKKFDPDCVAAFERRWVEVLEIQKRYRGDIDL